EFANVNGADKTFKEIVGHDGVEDALERNSRAEKKREAELKLILSSNFKGWNVSENFIAEKNLSNEPWEFGYAFAVSRPLSLTASPNPCVFCRENFSAGAEMYGGLGDRYSFGLKDTSHYFAPIVSFHSPGGPTFKVSPAIGLNDHSHGALLRFGVSYEIDQIFSKLRGREFMRLRRLLTLLVLASTTTLLFAVAIGDGSWLNHVPERERAKANPFDKDQRAVAAGAKLFRQNCASCHGEEGTGRDKKPNLHNDRVRSASAG